jgi:PleD family two-component response regulator
VNIYGAPGDILHPETAVQLLPSEIIPEKKNARLRILLAEDNKINQQYATLVLNKAGCQVTVVENGRKAGAQCRV